MPINIHLGVEGALPIILYIGMWAAFLCSVIWRPSIGIYILAFALPMQTGRYKIHDLFLGPEFVDLLLLGVMLGLAVKKQPIIAKSSITTLLLILAIFYYLSLWEGAFFIDAPLPLWITDARFSDWKNYVEMFLLALVVGSAIKDKQQVRNLIIVMCLAVLVVNRNYMSLMSGRDLSHFSYDVRDAGLMGYAGVNGLAAFEAMFASFLLGFFWCAKRLYVKLAVLVLLATCCYCLLYSFSRGGYAGSLVGLAVGCLKSKKVLILVFLLVICWQALLPTSVQERILMTENGDSGQTFDSSAQTRITIWQDAMELFKHNPVTGTGFETYEFMGRVEFYRDTHNYYLKVLAESGIVGMMLFLLLLWKLLKAGLDLYRGTDDWFWCAVGLGFVSLIASMIISNFFGDRWTYQQVDGYMWVLLGCVIRGLNIIQESHDTLASDSSAVIHEPEAVVA